MTASHETEIPDQTVNEFAESLLKLLFRIDPALFAHVTIENEVAYLAFRKDDSFEFRWNLTTVSRTISRAAITKSGGKSIDTDEQRYEAARLIAFDAMVTYLNTCPAAAHAGYVQGVELSLSSAILALRRFRSDLSAFVTASEFDDQAAMEGKFSIETTGVWYMQALEAEIATDPFPHLLALVYYDHVKPAWNAAEKARKRGRQPAVKARRGRASAASESADNWLVEAQADAGIKLPADLLNRLASETPTLPNTAYALAMEHSARMCGFTPSAVSMPSLEKILKTSNDWLGRRPDPRTIKAEMALRARALAHEFTESEDEMVGEWLEFFTNHSPKTGRRGQTPRPRTM